MSRAALGRAEEGRQMAERRNHDPTPEPFVTRHIASAEGGEQTYIYPKKDQNPTAVYDGLRALLPHVSGSVHRRLASGAEVSASFDGSAR